MQISKASEILLHTAAMAAFDRTRKELETETEESEQIGQKSNATCNKRFRNIRAECVLVSNYRFKVPLSWYDDEIVKNVFKTIEGCQFGKQNIFQTYIFIGHFLKIAEEPPTRTWSFPVILIIF